ncbi:hypothetical protein LYSCAS_28730 [Lysobacter caseinilyticus]|uniref:PilZ domain-containing protein n=1 Tax=Noviluteimonas caseinilytica TaxID=2675101 RepID=A0ABM7Q8V1_9GAMM|nr:hypothetical protein LYSCAS_28730 [Lysobacter caseinilyticus]
MFQGMTPPAQSDIRRSRVALPGEAILRGPAGDWHAPLEDLSVTGLSMPRPAGHGLALGQAVEVELVAGPPGVALQLQLLARVARSDARGVGLHFAPMPDRLEMALQRLLTRFGTVRDGGDDDEEAC